MPLGLQTNKPVKSQTKSAKNKCCILRCNFEHSVPETTGCVKGNGQGAGSRGWKPHETMVCIDRRFWKGNWQVWRPWRATGDHGRTQHVRDRQARHGHPARRETTDGRPWEIRMCQEALGAARTSGKAGELKEEPTGDHGCKDRGARQGPLARWETRGSHGKPREKIEQHGRPRCARGWWPRQGRLARCETKLAIKRRPEGP